jgi:hypothetical protein
MVSLPVIVSPDLFTNSVPSGATLTSSNNSSSINKYNILLSLSNIKVPSLKFEVSRPSIPSTILILDELALGSSVTKLVISSSNV